MLLIANNKKILSDPFSRRKAICIGGQRKRPETDLWPPEKGGKERWRKKSEERNARMEKGG